MAQVALEHVRKVYPGGVTAVDDVSLAIRDREFIVLVGPSGCGKSTTLRMVAGLEDITGGTIRIGERVVNDVQPKDRDIAMVFQNYALYPHMTVYKNMAFGLLLRRKLGLWDNYLAAVIAPPMFSKARAERKAIDTRVRETAKLLGIENLLARRPKELSGGQRQRVAVGRAIVREPKAFLFDEPLSNLDAKLRVEMRAELKRLHRRVQTTTIYVTHDQEEAMTLGDRVVVMKDGVIQQCDTPFAVYERPVNRFVASFVGMPPMNFLPGRIVQSGPGLLFDDGTNRLAIDARHVAKLTAMNAREVVLGIRPDAFTPAPESDNGSTIAVEVTVVEPLGDRVDVHAATKNNLTLRCRFDGRVSVREAERLQLRVDMPRVHFFEADGEGQNLTLAK